MGQLLTGPVCGHLCLHLRIICWHRWGPLGGLINIAWATINIWAEAVSWRLTLNEIIADMDNGWCTGPLICGSLTTCQFSQLTWTRSGSGNLTHSLLSQLSTVEVFLTIKMNSIEGNSTNILKEGISEWVATPSEKELKQIAWGEYWICTSDIMIRKCTGTQIDK